MTKYPLFLNLDGKSCLVFGGGKVATRKIQALLQRGARVTCVSEDFSKPLMKLVGVPLGGAHKRAGTRPAPTLRLKRMIGNSISLNGARLVIAATSDRSFNTHVARICRKKKIWVNVVDEPELCDFYVPAVVKRGPLQIAISTDGTSPLFARKLREELEKVIPPSTGKLLEKLGKVRKKLLRKS